MKETGECQRRMRIAVRRVQLDGPFRCALHLGHRVSRGLDVESATCVHMMDPGQPRIGWSVAGVELDGFLEVLPTSFDIFQREAVEVVHTEQVKVMKLYPFRWPLDEHFFIGPDQVHVELVHNRERDFVLDGKDIVEIAIETL